MSFSCGGPCTPPNQKQHHWNGYSVQWWIGDQIGKTHLHGTQMFRGLDYALDLARRLRMHVILSFTDNWSLAGGVAEYVKWSPTADR